MTRAAVATPRPGRRRLRRVVELGRPSIGYLRYGVLSGMLQQLLVLGGASVAAYVVGRAALGASYNGLVFYLLALVAAVLLQVRTPWLESIGFGFVANRVQARLRAEIFEAVERLTPAGLGGRRSGELGAATMDDVAAVRRFFAETLSTLIVASVVPLVGLVALAALSWRLAAVLVPFLALAASIPVWWRAEAGGRSAAVSSQAAELSAEVVDDIQGLREIITFGAVGMVTADLDGRAERSRRRLTTETHRVGLERMATELLVTSGVLCVLGVGAALVAHHALRRTFVPPAVILAAMSLAPISRLVDAAKGVNGFSAAAERIFALLDEAAPVVDRMERPVVLPAHPGIEFREVRFAYGPDLAPALEGVSFVAEPGQTVALVGHSGAGKSTSVNLLLRWWDVAAGSILIGGVDVRDLPQNQLHSVVGWVSQDVYLFNTTIRENVCLGRADVTDAEIEDAARAAESWEFIAAMPRGLDTRTGERGVLLSGGQRQRLAITRAFVADPPVLVLDEPVSNLDTGNERAITAAMARIRKGRTTLIVAHRLSTVQSADRIVVLDHGRVAEIGTHTELLGRRGVYRAFVESQMASIPSAAST